MLSLIAQISNPAVEGMPQFTGDSGVTGAAILGQYIAIGITTAVTLGSLAVLIYFILGAINWITAGGDKGKIEKAQQRIIQAFIGLALLVFAVAILGFVGPRFFNIDLLRLNFLNQLSGSHSVPRGVEGSQQNQGSDRLQELQEPINQNRLQ